MKFPAGRVLVRAFKERDLSRRLEGNLAILNNHLIAVIGVAQALSILKYTVSFQRCHWLVRQTNQYAIAYLTFIESP